MAKLSEKQKQKISHLINYLVSNKDQPIKVIAYELGITERTLQNWKNPNIATTPYPKDYKIIAQYFGYTSEIFEKVDDFVNDEFEINLDNLHYISEGAFQNKEALRNAKGELIKAVLNYAKLNGFIFDDSLIDCFMSYSGLTLFEYGEKVFDNSIKKADNSKQIKLILDFESHLFRYIDRELNKNFRSYINMKKEVIERKISELNKENQTMEEEIQVLNAKNDKLTERLEKLNKAEKEFMQLSSDLESHDTDVTENSKYSNISKDIENTLVKIRDDKKFFEKFLDSQKDFILLEQHSIKVNKAELDRLYKLRENAE